MIKVQYDAYNRQFKLIDAGLAHTLADGERYLLIADLSTEDLEIGHSVEESEGIAPVVA